MKPSTNFIPSSSPIPSEESGEISIGIFGGSFNPIHNGHIALAEAFLKKKKLAEVWFMVSPLNPFKVKATANNPHFKASDYEFHLPKPSYTWNTLQHLSNDYPTHRFTLLIGGDNWEAFDRWYHAEDILAHYPIVVYPRHNQRLSETSLPHGVTILQTPFIDISSTDIRQRVSQGKTIDGLVPQAIIYDVQHLY